MTWQVKPMLLVLGSALDLPLRERTMLLVAAGFAPVYRTSTLADPGMQHVEQAIRRILELHEPRPALLLDHGWNLLRLNNGARRLFTWLGLSELPEAPVNVHRLVFGPALGLRRFVAHFDAIADTVLERMRAEVAIEPTLQELLQGLERLRGERHQPGLRGATVERGTLWCSDGSLEWGEAGDLVCSPDDLCGVVGIGAWSGCCGPTGMDGKNLACAAGHSLATRVGDCWTPSFTFFSPRDVVSEAAPADAAVLPGHAVSLGGDGPLTDPRELWARLHERLGCSAWHGADVATLLEDRVTATDEPLVLLWHGSELSRQAGLPVDAVLDAFVTARRVHRTSVMLIPA